MNVYLVASPFDSTTSAESVLCDSHAAFMRDIIEDLEEVDTAPAGARCELATEGGCGRVVVS
jgi:hypothetical protein